MKQKEQRNGFGNQDAIAQRSSPGLVCTRANRHIVEHAAAAPAGETDASVPIRRGIPTPAQRVSRIGAETDVLELSAAAGAIWTMIGKRRKRRKGYEGGLVRVSGGVKRWHVDTGRPRCSADPGFRLTQVKRTKRRNVFRQIRMRPLNDPRQGSLPTVLLHLDQVPTDASVPIRLLIPTPGQRVTQI